MRHSREQQDKIVRMKVQTAKVLWQENRREAAFLVLESVDDPRADELRQRLGCDADDAVGRRTHPGVSWTAFASVIVIVMIAAFALGTLLDLRRDAARIAPLPAADTALASPIPATLPAVEAPVELTGTASQIQLTQSALAAQQGGAMSRLDATETARYQQATGTAEARETAAAGQ
jgi:hypothetical protein